MQYDVYGNVFGLLSAHPVTPLVTLHHLDVVEPIFPDVTQVDALKRLTVPMNLDSAALMQQSICYDKQRVWTVSVSWGYAVQIIRGLISPREMEIPTRTFFNWHIRANYTAHAFNTRPVSRNDCQKPFVFHMSKAKYDSSNNQTISEYVHQGSRVPHPECKWNMEDPSVIERVHVYKKPDPHLWDKVSSSISFNSIFLFIPTDVFSTDLNSPRGEIAAESWPPRRKVAWRLTLVYAWKVRSVNNHMSDSLWRMAIL